jgi:hypothetical protein
LLWRCLAVPQNDDVLLTCRLRSRQSQEQQHQDAGSCEREASSPIASRRHDQYDTPFTRFSSGKAEHHETSFAEVIVKSNL